MNVTLKVKMKSIGALDPGEQEILANFYNSLTSKGILGWNVTNNLCGQTGVTCDTSNPYQRVTKLYFLFGNHFLFYSENQIVNRDLNAKALNGTIPTEFGNLTSLQYL